MIATKAPFFTFLCCILIILLAGSEARDVSFDNIFVDEPSQDEYIPKISHFVFVYTRPLQWIEYAAIKSSIVTLGVKEVNLWVPPGAKFEGRTWELVLAFPEVRIRRVEMPTSIYGNVIKVAAHSSDILRLEAMYNEGGIYMDYNAIALRSNDDLIYNNSTKDTVMAYSNWGRAGNAWFMAKPHAKFLRRWMEAYKVFDDRQWAAASTQKAGALARQFPNEVTLLDIHTWFYPQCCSNDATDKLWFGKTFTDIDENYGTHQWDSFKITTGLMSPEAVRTIDTPFFCRIRHLFDKYDDDFVSVEEHLNPNCSIVDMDHLAMHPAGLISSYNFHTDSAIKWDDLSGNNLHGWAPWATGLIEENGATVREFRQNNFAVLPLPTGYDARRGTISVEIMFQPGHYREDITMTMARIRLDDDHYMSWGFAYSAQQETAVLNFVMNSNNDATGKLVLASNQSVPIYDSRYHTFTLAWDRLDQGFVVAIMDAEEIMRSEASIMQAPRIGQELWINSASQEEYDMSLRARLRHLRLYSNFTLDETITQAAKDSASSMTAPTFSIVHKLGFTSLAAMLLWLLVPTAVILPLAILLTRFRTHEKPLTVTVDDDSPISDMKERMNSWTPATIVPKWFSILRGVRGEHRSQEQYEHVPVEEVDDDDIRDKA